jgi:hypothetical protein
MDRPTSRAALISMGTKVPDWLMAPAGNQVATGNREGWCSQFATEQHDPINQVGMSAKAWLVPRLCIGQHDRVLVQGNAKVHLSSWLVQPSKMGLEEARS